MPMMGATDRLGNGQAQTRTARISGAGALRPGKSHKHLSKIRIGNAMTIVLDSEADGSGGTAIAKIEFSSL